MGWWRELGREEGKEGKREGGEGGRGRKGGRRGGSECAVEGVRKKIEGKYRKAGEESEI